MGLSLFCFVVVVVVVFVVVVFRGGCQFDHFDAAHYDPYMSLFCATNNGGHSG